jgi:hypothetical protein
MPIPSASPVPKLPGNVAAPSLSQGYLDFLMQAQPASPVAGSVRIYYDSDGIKHVINSAGEDITNLAVTQESAFGGSVGVTSDVQGPMLLIELLARTFDKNVLLRDGDNITLTNSFVSHGDVIPVSDKYLRVIRNLGGSGSIKIGSTSSLNDTGSTEEFTWASDGDLIHTLLDANISTAVTALSLARSVADGQVDISAFNLTSLGLLTTSQALMVNSLATAYGWTLTGTVDTTTAWSAIATWMATSGDRDEFFAIVIPSHVSSMEPSIVSEVVNRGGNLAYPQDMTLSGWSATGSATIEGHNTFSILSSNQGAILDFIPAVAGETFSYSVLFGSGAGNVRLRLLWYDINGDAVGTFIDSAYQSPATSVSILNEEAPTNAVIAKLYMQGNTAGDYQVEYIQFNQGSTANDYATPLNSPFTLGSRSENQLRNGNGEEDIQAWSIGDSATEFSYDGTDFVLNNGDATQAFVNSAEIAPTDVTVYINVTDIAETEVSFQVFVDAQNDATPSGWTWDGTNLKYYYVTTGVEEISQFFTGVKKVRVVNADSTLNDTSKFREVQLIKGEYTLAQLQAKGYVSYEPIFLLSSVANDGLSTVADRIYGQGDQIWLEKNVSTRLTRTPDLNNLIPDPENQNFDGGTIGDWLVSADGAGTCAYNTDAIGGNDKQGLLTSSGDTYLFGALSTTSLITLVEGKEYLLKADVYVPAGNTLKDVRLWLANIDYVAINQVSETIAGDTWVSLVYHVRITGSDVSGNLAVGFYGDPADADKLYYDNVRVQEVGFEYGDLEIDTTELVTNGDMSSSTGWTFNGGWSYDAGNSEADFDDATTGYISRADINIVEGNRYRIQFTIKNCATTGALLLNDTNNDVLFEGSWDSYKTIENGTYVFDYLATHTPVGATRFWSHSGVSADTFSITDISITVFNIQENLSPNLEDISEFASGSLQQPASQGINHTIIDNIMLVSVTHYLGLGAYHKAIESEIQAKLNVADSTTVYRLRLTTVTTGLANDQVYFFAFSDIDGFPDYIPGCTLVELVLKDADVDSYVIYDNGILVTAGAAAPAAADVLVDLKIARSDALVIKTIDLS